MKRVGVVLAVDKYADTRGADAWRILGELHRRYPGVRFTFLAGGTSSVVFEYDDEGGVQA